MEANIIALMSWVKRGCTARIDFHLAGQRLSHSGSHTGLLSAAYSIGQPHLVVSEFKALGSPTVGGRLLVTLSDFHSLSGCLFSCWKSR